MEIRCGRQAGSTEVMGGIPHRCADLNDGARRLLFCPTKSIDDGYSPGA
jgi:hypothetical protein